MYNVPIDKDLMEQLYKLKTNTKRDIKSIVNEAVKQYLENNLKNIKIL